MGISPLNPPFLTFIEARMFLLSPTRNYTNKRFGCKRLATFDAEARVRVYYTKLTRIIIVEK